MDSRIWKWALIIIVGGGFGIWRASSNWSSDSDEVLQVAMKIVHEWDCYADNKTLIDQCAERAHKSAFAKAYTPSGRRRSSDIDPEKYLAGFFRAMSNEFDLLSRHDLKKCLSDGQARINEATPEETQGTKG